MEPLNLAQKRSSNIMDQKGSGNTSTTSTHPSPDLVERHYIASANGCSSTWICPWSSLIDFFFVFNIAAKYYFYDNYFDLPGAFLCGRVVDMLHKVKVNSYIFILMILISVCWYLNIILFCQQHGNEVNSDFWKDMIAAIEHNYNTSAFKGTLYLKHIGTNSTRIFIALFVK